VNWQVVEPARPTFPGTEANDSRGVLLAKLTPSTTAPTTALAIQRNYSDEKFVLRANLITTYFVQGAAVNVTSPAALTGTPVINYEFTVKRTLDSLVAERLEDKLVNWFNNLPTQVQLTGTGTPTVLVEGMYDKTLPAAITDQPTLLYGITTSETGYYVVPVVSGVGTLSAVQAARMQNVTQYVVFREGADGKDVSAGFISSSSLITNSDGALLSGLVGLGTDIPVLLLNVTTGKLETLTTSELAFSFEGKAANEAVFNFEIVGRILLSTDSVEETKQVNSSELTHSVSLFYNPLFEASSGTQFINSGTGALLINSGTRSLVITASTGGVFKQGSTIPMDLITISGVGGGAAFATEFAKGAQVIRESDTVIRIIGFSGVAVNAITNPTSGLNVTLSVTIDPAAFRVLPNNKTVTLEGSTQVGVAVIRNATPLLFDSGVNYTVASGALKFDIVLLGGQTFKAGNDGVLGTSEVEISTATINNADLRAKGIVISGLVNATNSGILNVTVTGNMVDSVAVSELRLKLKEKLLTLDATDVDVLTSRNAENLTFRDKLEITILDPDA
jgi:hypothetical protein